MSRVLSLLQRVGESDPDVMFFCPGCNCGHGVWVTGPNKKSKSTWTWNGSLDKPTFSPSIKITYETAVPPVTPENLDEFKRNPWPQTKEVKICHSHVTDGKITFCPDSTHALAGKTVDLPDFDALQSQDAPPESPHPKT